MLCIQDTTELDFNGQETAGLGPLNYEARGGMYLHPTYAVTPGREPLGVLDAWMWAREKRDADGVRPGQKESTRCIEGYERGAEMAAEMPDTRLVYLADREADLVVMMCRARDLGHRRTGRCVPSTTVACPRRTATNCGITLTMPGREKQKARTVRQQLWARAVDIADGGKTGRITATCLVARRAPVFLVKKAISNHRIY